MGARAADAVRAGVAPGGPGLAYPGRVQLQAAPCGRSAARAPKTPAARAKRRVSARLGQTGAGLSGKSANKLLG